MRQSLAANTLPESLRQPRQQGGKSCIFAASAWLAQPYLWQTQPVMGIRDYYLGCPSWGFKPWSGLLYAAGSKPASYLEQYAAVFNAVEGNTTFYSVPLAKWVERWRASTPEGFRFCFKFPKLITHEMGLVGTEAETLAFLQRMAPLGERLGPFMLQLPASFGPRDLPALDAFLAILPQDFRYAVETRHVKFFAGGKAEQKLEEILQRQGRTDRVILDTRALRAGDAEHPDILRASSHKPDLPVRLSLTGRCPVLRFIGHPEAEVNTPWLKSWAETVAGWILDGLEPHIFMHCPNDVHAPAMAREFHRLLGKTLIVGALPSWPGIEPQRQLSLF